MGSYNLALVEEAIQLMNVQPRDRILDVGCGEGEASRRLASLASEGTVVGLDVSDERIRNARAQSTLQENLLFLWASAEEIPWQENFFTKALCAESFHHFENSERALREIHRVLAPGGLLWMVHPVSQQDEPSGSGLAERTTPAPERSTGEWETLFARCGYEGYACCIRESGALLISARKPLAGVLA